MCTLTRARLLSLIGASALMVSAAVLVMPAMVTAQVNLQTSFRTSLKTSWGEPDLQGIWTVETDTPLQRSPKYGTRELFTDAERDELDKERAAMMRRDKRVERGTEQDVAGAYNALFMSMKRTGTRTSMIVDPPNGRLPPLTPEAQKIAAAEREYRLALLQATESCQTKNPVGCPGGKYDQAPSSLRDQPPPRYNTGRINRHDGPEDGSLSDRCLTLGLPEFGTAYGGSFRRIVQTPGGVTMYYDVGQGQGWQRNVVMDGRPHLPAAIRQWYGDSRARYEGDALVIDVTNFSPKTDVLGAREKLHLVERWTRTGPDTLQYVVTVDDPTVWTRPWTAKLEYSRQSEQQNRVYYEPRCVEGNYGHRALMLGARVEELAYAEGGGPHPATKDNATDFVGVEEDPFQ